VIEVDKESFDSVVLQSEIPVVVDLWGPKCGPCLALLPQVEELAKEYEGRVTFCKLNVRKIAGWSFPSRSWACPRFFSIRQEKLVSRLPGGEGTLDSIRENPEKLLQA
jgi:thioredoxin 1